MSNFPILSLLIFIPLIGSLFILVIRGEEKIVKRNSRQVALWTSTMVFALSLLLWKNFDITTAEFQFVDHQEWMPNLNIAYHVGVDGISILFVLLTTLLIPICILASWDSIQERVKEYMIAFLILETMMIGMFV